MQGTNLELYKELSQIEGLDIVASGGISSLKEIEILKNEGVWCDFRKSAVSGCD
ncbi:MAG: HisA/HisF-related TIM barrel protein [Clostridium fessum]